MGYIKYHKKPHPQHKMCREEAELHKTKNQRPSKNRALIKKKQNNTINQHSDN